MTSATLPLILLFPGAFGTAAGFDAILPFLSEAGLSTFPVSYLSSNPSDPSTATCANDIADVREKVLVRLVEEEQKDVIILAHSYGGIVAGAAKGFDKTSRAAKGLKGGVVGLMYVAGNILLEGESLVGSLGGQYPPFIKLNKPSPNVALIEPAMDILYNDCESSRSSELAKYMVPHANLVFETPASAPAWADRGFDGRRGYVRTLRDCCNPTFVLDMWLSKTRVEWDVVDFDTGHMPFVSQPEKLAKQLVAWVEQFTTK